MTYGRYEVFDLTVVLQQYPHFLVEVVKHDFFNYIVKKTPYLTIYSRVSIPLDNFSIE